MDNKRDKVIEWFDKYPHIFIGSVLIIFTILFMILVGCKHKTSGVDDEYSRGFFNCMAIIQKRGLVKDNVDNTDWPYWIECERSYLQKVDLYNDWDSSYGLFNNKYLQHEHPLPPVYITKANNWILPKGTIVGIEPNGDTVRIGDSAWHYVGKNWDYQFDMLTSTKQYPKGIWLPVGKVIKNKCQCNPFYKFDSIGSSFIFKYKVIN